MLKGLTKRAYRKVAEVQTAIWEIIDVVNELRNVPFSQGRSVTVSFGASSATQRVAHGFGRPIRGWIITDRDASQAVWRVATTDREDTYVTFTAKAAGDVTFWLY